ncbi:MAG: hypothetical protein LBG06_08155 [Deltaproteobacteria bacterium]|nr:hypothetical protein [Deltaproteobacteria bacterium]
MEWKMLTPSTLANPCRGSKPILASLLAPRYATSSSFSLPAAFAATVGKRRDVAIAINAKRKTAISFLLFTDRLLSLSARRKAADMDTDE